MQNTPKHIAIIMDGNGRWANQRGLPRTFGHKQGAEAARRAVQAAAELEISYLTLFGFSSENWKRPQEEVGELMKLLRHYLRSETAELHKSGARLKIIGNRTMLDDDIIELINNAENLTKDNTRITLVIALNYGGRYDILQAAYKAKGETFSKFEKSFEQNLYTNDMPDPDILIRTGGDQRISNFLLWQCAYAELVFTNKYWPDFEKADLEAAITDFAGRERRFGGIKQAKG